MASDHDEIVERLRSAATRHWSLTALDAADEIERLRSWKRGAIEVIQAWERVYDALGQPGHLGESKAAAAEREVLRLWAALSGRSDREGEPCPECGHRLSAYDWCPSCLAHVSGRSEEASDGR